MRTCPSCGNEIDEDYCSSCGHGINSNTLPKPMIKNTSKFWYLLPILFGIIGGVIAYFVLRKSNSRKARNCLLIGIGLMIIGIGFNVAIEFTLTDEQKEERKRESEERRLEKEKNELQKELKRLEERDAEKMAELIKQKQAEAEEAKLDTEEEILEFIQNYKGTDNAGPTLNETFEKLLYISYPNENILTSPSTTVSMFAHKDFDKTDYNRYWKVELEIKTYRETVYYEWIIDNETNLVYPGNEDGKSFLNILDSFDK